jgi:isopenicillin-N epimerase
MRQHWTLDPNVFYLNHGSFGACPRDVMAIQQDFRDRLERQPIQFYVRDVELLLDEARAFLAGFLNAEERDLAFVPNATTGVNAVLRSLTWEPGDQLLVTNQAYNATNNALHFVAARCGAEVVCVDLPFPMPAGFSITDALLENVTERTKLLLLDHITSQTAMILPAEEIVAALAERGIDTLVDGAHAPGMLDLDLNAIGAAYYTGNCHKWLCAPKGAAFLHVRADRQEAVRPVVISHGANSTRTSRSRFQQEFDWVGTCDITPWLTVPAAISWMGEQWDGGWPAIREHNRASILRARQPLVEALGTELPCADELLGSLASFPLPPIPSWMKSDCEGIPPLQDELMKRYGIEVPLTPRPGRPGEHLLRISAQLYNTDEEYLYLAEALRELLS